MKPVMERLRGMRKLTDMSHALTNAVSLDDLFQMAVSRAAELLAAPTALLLIARDDGVLAVRAAHGVAPALAARLVEQGRELNEAILLRLAALLDAKPTSLLGVPLVVAGAITGVLVVCRPGIPYVPDDEWLLSALADQAAVGLETARLGEIGEFREQLIGIIGHDLRNPLNTILMGAQLLLEREGLAERETEVARKITSSAALAVRLIDQLLDLTRSRLGGGIPIDPVRVDLAKVCRHVVGETELTHPDRPLRVEARGELTGMFDADRMYQLLSNLVGNAIQHGAPRSPIGLTIDGRTPEVIIEVSSTGEPIPSAMLPSLFDAFRKKPSDHPSRSHGLGLGLFIAKQITVSHGGTIAVTSSERDGTVFRVRLPRVASAPARSDERRMLAP